MSDDGHANPGNWVQNTCTNSVISMGGTTRQVCCCKKSSLNKKAMLVQEQQKQKQCTTVIELKSSKRHANKPTENKLQQKADN